MNTLLLLIVCFGLLLAVGRGLDLVLWTDLYTGLCMAGSVWWRYAVLAAALLLSLVLPRLGAPRRPDPLCRRRPLPGVLAFAAAVCFGAAGLLRLALDGPGPVTLARTLLELLCAAWLCCLGRAWLRRGSWRAPAGGLTLAVFGTAVFYWCILARFLQNSSSWHRVIPTAAVWQLCAVMLFLAAMLRALFLPGTQSDGMLCGGALASFWLCLCWEVPQTVIQTMCRQIALPELAFRLGLWCMGALGGCCALLYLEKPRRPAQREKGLKFPWLKCPKH